MSRRPRPVLSLTLPALLLVGLTGGCSRGGSNTTDGDEPMIDPIPASEIPPSPVLRPDEALADFEVDPGFTVELVAAEPDVVAPVAATFDGNGAMWVVEMRGYMPKPDGVGEDEPVGRIRVLRDLDGDWSYETATTFLDGLVMPRAVAISGNGVLVAEPPNLWFYENHDYAAGRRTLVDSTYAVGGNPEHQPNGLVHAIDNWIYSAKANVRYRYRNGRWEKDSTAFRGQWGISQDDWGRLFYNHNSAVLQGDNVQPNTFPWNPNHEATHTNVGASKSANRVFTRRINPGVNRAYRQATLGDDGKLTDVTGTCGPVIYRGSNFPPEFYGSAFVMEPTGNVVMRVALEDSSGIVVGSRPYDGREFLSATDERFRPVNAYTGPDGSLYILDMYRGVIQHVTYLTDYLRRQIEQRDLADPIDLGRIYRVRHAATALEEPPALEEADGSMLVENLSHTNGWRRDTAQRIFVDRNDTSVVPSLRALVASADSDVARVHALWTLEGLSSLRRSDLTTALAVSRNPKVTSAVLRLAGILAADAEPAEARRLLNLVETASDADREVALHRVLALHRFRSAYPEHVDQLLMAAASAKNESPEFVDAVVGGIHGDEEAFQLRADSQRENLPALYAAVEQARFTAQTGPALDALALGEDHAAAFNRGRTVYNTNCAVCHGFDGRGLPAQAPSLRRSSWVLQDPGTAIRIVLDGVTGPIAVNGTTLRPPDVQDVMPGFRSNKAITDDDIAAMLTFVRNSWSNRAPAVTPGAVAGVRAATRRRAGNPYTADELVELRYTSTDWHDLTPDAELTGWQRLGGSATYERVGDEIVGTTVARSPNTFLATRQHYDDFVLEFEVLVDSLINSGVQIRSNSDPDYQNGRVNGYQVEIDPSDRAWSAGIYDEARRGWLFDLRGNPAARSAFRRDGWNHYRVEARGPHIRTWINGVLAADLIDDMTPSGFIALQVHSVGSEDLVGRMIRWRNLRIITLPPEE